MNASDYLVCEARQTDTIKPDLKKEKHEQQQKEAETKEVKEAKGQPKSKGR